MFLSNLINVGPLIACGVSLLLAAICYGKKYKVTRLERIIFNQNDAWNMIGIAAVTGQAFASSK